MLRRLLARLSRRGAPTDDEIARELRDHLELDAESLASSGSSSARDAEYSAHRRFGNMSSINEAVRHVWHWTWLEQLEQDVRHGLRAISHRPLYAVAVVITLAMGIG